MDHVQTKNHFYQSQDEKKWDVFLSTCTPVKHKNITPFMENPKAKMWQQKLQEMSNFQTWKWNETKN